MDKSYFKKIFEEFPSVQDFEKEVYPLISDILLPAKPKSVLEIGIEHGGTAALWLGLPSVEYYVGVDVAIQERATNLQESYKNKKVNLICGDSTKEETITKVLENTPKEKFSVLYIDGSHDEDIVYQDISNYYQFLQDGGVLIFHDYNATGVRPAIERHFKEGFLPLNNTKWYEGQMGTFVIFK